VEVDLEGLAEFCKAHGVHRLALFGSALREDFGPESDVDILVEFDPGVAPGLMSLAEMELELSGFFGGREVEIRTYEALSHRFRDRIRATASTLYDAA